MTSKLNIQSCLKFALMASVSLVPTLGGGQVEAQSFGAKLLGNTTDNVVGAAIVPLTPKSYAPINRCALVTRHNIQWNSAGGDDSAGQR
jgi:hypothetical protein